MSSRAELHILKPARDKLTRSLDNIVDWLLDSAPTHTSLRSITDGLVDKLREAGVPVERINLGVLAVHPEMGGYAVLWESGMEASFEVPVRREDMKHPTYTNSPIRFVVEENQPVDFDLTGPDIDASFPVLPEFRDKGFTHYLGFPVPYGDGPTPAILTLCTRDPSGFSPEVSAGLPRIFRVLGLLINVVETQRLARTVLKTYLGRQTSERVLAGEITRGQGERIRAALWFCDLRGYTAMMAELGSFPMIDVMNHYFDCMAEAVWAEGGEILKFMGDAMLVVFRLDDERDAPAVAQSAVRAAQVALRNLAVLSESRVHNGELPLHAGVSVHLGHVVYGNIGASSRLDFTVMGHSVNLVARIQGVAGAMNEPLLVSTAVAEHLEGRVESIGLHPLKGVPEPVEIFRPSETIGSHSSD